MSESVLLDSEARAAKKENQRKIDDILAKYQNHNDSDEE
jgi:hypothetical protein